MPNRQAELIQFVLTMRKTMVRMKRKKGGLNTPLNVKRGREGWSQEETDDHVALSHTMEVYNLMHAMSNGKETQFSDGRERTAWRNKQIYVDGRC